MNAVGLVAFATVGALTAADAEFDVLGAATGAGSTLALRLLAVRFDWRLPTVRPNAAA